MYLCIMHTIIKINRIMNTVRMYKDKIKTEHLFFRDITLSISNLLNGIGDIAIKL